MTVELNIKVCGAPQVLLGETALMAQLSVRGLALFIYLAVTGGAHSRDLLADLLWSDLNNQQARNKLRYLLPDLRKVLGDYLLITAQTVAFDRSQPYQLDSARLRHTLAAAPEAITTADLQAALDLYQGEFLAGFRLRHAPRFDAWVAVQQTELRLLAVQGLQALAERYYTGDNYTAGLIASQRLLSLAPWHEAGHRLQMKLLTLAGQRSTALAHYQRLEQLLAAELAIEPAMETTQLYEAIRSGRFLARAEQVAVVNEPNTLIPQTAALVVPTAHLPPNSPIKPSPHLAAWLDRHNLPHQLTPFYGREQELADLYLKLHQDEHRLITLVGGGGVGKTRVALALAQAIFEFRFPLPNAAAAGGINHQFADGIWFVPLIGLTAGPELPAQLAVAIAQAMGFPFSDTSALITQLFAYLYHKRALLILDNFEQLVASADFIRALLEETTGIKLLITSRSTLHLPSEYRYALAGLPTPDADQCRNELGHELAHYSSVALFRERAQRVQRNFQLNATNQLDVSHICRLLDGLPLGIELAAAQLRMYTCSEIRLALAHNAISLSVHYRDLPIRHRSLAAVLADSWSLLTVDEQTVLAALAIFQGSFTVDAAVAIVTTTPAVLEMLCDKSLLQRLDLHCYLLHQLVRHYATEKLHAAGAASVLTIAAQHARYYLTLVRDQESVLNGATPRRAIALIHQALLNIEHAWQWAVAQGESTLLAQSCQGLCAFYLCTYLHEQGKARFTAAVEMIQQQLAVATEAAVVAVLEGDLAVLLCAQGESAAVKADYQGAMPAIQRAVHLANKHALPKIAAWGYYLWGTGLAYLRDYAPAEQQLSAALTLARTTAVEPLVIMALSRLGSLAETLADYSTALQLYHEALALSHAEHALFAENLVLTMLGSVYQRLGDFQQAKMYCEAAFAQIEQEGILANKAELAISLGAICDNLGNYAAAQRYYLAALHQSRNTNAGKLEASLLGNLGISADYVGNYTAALAYSLECLQIWQQLGITGQMPVVLINLGLHAHHLNDQLAAQTYGRQALAISQTINNLHLQSYAWTILGHAASALAELAEAEAAYTAAVALARTIALPLMTIEPLAGLVRVALAQQTEPVLIQPHLEAIFDYLTQHAGNGLEEPFRVYLTCYQGLLANNDARAEALLKTAYDLLQQRAAQIDEPVMQRSFLENVAANRELIGIAQTTAVCQ